MGKTPFDSDCYYAALDVYYAEAERAQAGDSLGKVVSEWAIDRAAGLFLHDLVIAQEAALTIEVGLCQGASALHFAAAHAVMGSGLHLALDPFQDQFFGGQGRLSIARFGLDPWFRHVAERSDRVLPLLVMAGLFADLLFIDGDHRFDAVFHDFYWADKLVRPGGLIILDEAGYDCPTARVSSFIRTNLTNYQPVESPARLYVFRKIGADARDFSDQHPF